MLKAVLYYPVWKDLINISEERFAPIYARFPQIKFVYANSISQFELEIIDADYLLASTITTEAYAQAKKLKALFVFSAGKEKVPQSVINNLRCYFGHFHGRLMAESLLGAILFFNQRFPRLLDLQKNKLWQRQEFSQRMVLEGQHIAFIGYGSIGKYCASLLNNFGMKSYAIQRSAKQGQCAISGAQYVHVDDMDAILPTLNHVVSLLPYSESSINLFNADFFAKLSPQAYFYNLGRGHTVKENDLANALRNKIIAGAMLDVFQSEPLPETSELWELENLFIMPHISAFYQNYIDLYLVELTNQINDELKYAK